METDELCLLLKGGCRLTAKDTEKCTAPTEKETEQDCSGTQDAGEGEDA
jgi:hypothetical protein